MGFIPRYLTVDARILNTLILNNSVISHFNKKAIRPQGEAKDVQFRGMIYTDGIDVFVLKKNSVSGKKSISLVKNESRYVEVLEEEELQVGIGKCVFGNPVIKRRIIALQYNHGCHDSLYLMHKSSTAKRKSTFRYKRNHKAVETKIKKIRKLRDDMKPDHITTAKLFLSQHISSTTGKEKSINHIQEKPNGLILFRKMKFSSFIHQLKADKHLGKDIRKRFENPAILILGNWPPKQNKYHELIKGIGTRRMLAKEGFEVYLIDKFKTSSLWPACQNGEIKSFKRKYPTMDCHGLLRRCKNQQCLKPVTKSTEDNTVQRKIE
ncbi:hypothetical protein F4703DRAFT_1902505 [Phycomyces blakesleeanus]